MTEPLEAALDLAGRIAHVAETDPERLALINVHLTRLGTVKTSTTNFRTLNERAERAAIGIRSIGVKEGSLCSYMIPPGEDAMVVALALWKVGATMVGIEPHSHGLTKVAFNLDKVKPEFFFGTPEAHLARIVFGWGRSSVKTNIMVGGPGAPGIHSLAKLEKNAKLEPFTANVSPNDPALIAFTTGSTGSPKPTVMTQANLAAMMNGVSTLWEFTGSDDIIDMPTFPIFWIVALSNGGTTIVPPMDFALKGPGQADSKKLVAAMEKHKVSSMFGSPALLENLVNYCGPRGITLPHVRRVVSGGAEIQGPLYASFKELIPNGELYSNYGATEALPVAEIDGTTVLAETWPQSEQGAGVCVGTPIPGVEARIIAIDDGDIATIADATEMPTGEIGEAIVRSPHIADHYYNLPEENAANKIADGDTKWHRLGDCGFLDEKGRLWVVGRRSHRVVVGEETWFPLLCEPVFNAHRAVHRSALIAVTDQRGVTAPAICVELNPGNDSKHAHIETELRELASKYEATHGIWKFIFVKKLPVDKRHNAKIDRPALSRDASAGSIS